MKTKHAIPLTPRRGYASYLKPSLLLTALASALVLCPQKSQAASYTLNLTGTIGTGVFTSFDGPTTHFDNWDLVLNGLNPMTAITVDVGDIITLNVLLDGAFTVPASVDFTFFSSELGGPMFPSGTNEVSSTYILRNGGVDILTTPTNFSQGIPGVNITPTFGLAPPSNTAFTFDELTTTFTVVTLSGPALINTASLSYQLNSPIPEPSAAILLGLGSLSLLGLRKRRA